MTFFYYIPTVENYKWSTGNQMGSSSTCYISLKYPVIRISDYFNSQYYTNNNCNYFHINNKIHYRVKFHTQNTTE